MVDSADLGQVETSHPQHELLAPIELTINQALQKETSVSDAVAELTSSQQWSKEDLTLDDYAYLLFSIFLSKIMAIPRESAYRESLTELLREIQAQPSPDGEEDPEFWTELPSFWLQISEITNAEGLYETIGEPLPWERKMSVSQWANLHSFIAEWRASEPGASESSASGSYFTALILLRHVLETPRKRQTLAQNLPAIAAWMNSKAGAHLRANCERNEALDPRDSTRPRVAGPEEPELYDGPDSWNEDRWDFWMTRLGELSNDGELGPDACGSAREAKERMEVLKRHAAES